MTGGVLVVDDHPIVLQGPSRRMREDAGVGAVLEARDVASGYRLFRRHHPDVVIVDLAIQSSGLGGLPLIRRIRSHDPRMPVFSSSACTAIRSSWRGPLKPALPVMWSRTRHRRNY